MAINDNAVLKGTGTYYTVVEDPTAQDAVLNLSDHHFDTSDDSDLEFEMAKKRIRKSAAHRAMLRR